MTTASTRELGLAELAAAVGNGTTTSVTAVTTALDAIEASQPTLNAFRVIRRERALAEAAEADRRVAAGVRLPLLGVPIAIKDDTDLSGTPTAFGCGGDFPDATVDAEVVRRLRAAGAVIVGKTNTCEIGQRSPTPSTPQAPPTHHPRNGRSPTRPPSATPAIRGTPNARPAGPRAVRPRRCRPDYCLPQ